MLPKRAKTSEPEDEYKLCRLYAIRDKEFTPKIRIRKEL